MKKCLGIEIGHSRIKAAYMERGQVKQYISERVDAGSIRDPGHCAEFLREILREHKIRCKNMVFVLRYENAYVKRLCLPLMTVSELELNLPYEFHDYIGNELEKYQFDYAVLGRSETDLDILAAACRKELCERLSAAAKNAGLRLVGLVPEVVGLERILKTAGRRDYAIADLGSVSIRIHFYKDGIYDTSRTIEPGCSLLEDNINKEETEAVREFCRMTAMQIQRVLNFYCYINGDNSIDGLYCCGGGMKYPLLLEMLESVLDIPVKAIGGLLENYGMSEKAEWSDSPQSFGVLLTGREQDV